MGSMEGAETSNTTTTPSAVPAPKSRFRRFLKFLFKTGLLVVVIWLAGDFIYSRVVLYKLGRYEQSFQWDANGVRAGQGAFEVGEGETALLLVHGINFSPVAYQKLAPELAQSGFKCRAMRLPGFGLHVREYEQYEYPVWLDAIDHEVKNLSANHNRVIIVAHSLGAAVALRYLAERNPNIFAIVLLAPAIEVSDQRSPVFSTRFWHEFSKRTLLFTKIVLSPFPYDMNDPGALTTIPQLQFTPSGIVDQTFSMIDQNRGQASQFQVPLLMILSPTDQVIDSPAAEAYFKAWGTSDKRLIWQERAAHMIPLDFDWELAADAIAEFAQTNSAADKSQKVLHESAK